MPFVRAIYPEFALHDTSSELQIKPTRSIYTFLFLKSIYKHNGGIRAYYFLEVISFCRNAAGVTRLPRAIRSGGTVFPVTLTVTRGDI